MLPPNGTTGCGVLASEKLIQVLSTGNEGNGNRVVSARKMCPWEEGANTLTAKYSTRNGMRNKNKAIFEIQLNSNPEVSPPASLVWECGIRDPACSSSLSPGLRQALEKLMGSLLPCTQRTQME